MPEQYFAVRPTSAHRVKTVGAVLQGHPLTFVTDAGVFSHGAIDRGTDLLVRSLRLAPDAEVLDLGCGYGVLGIVAAVIAPNGRVVMTDINVRAVELARRNVQGNAVPHAEVRLGPFYEPVAGERFDAIVMNPPIRAGRSVVLRMIDGAPGHLRAGGALWMVARTRQGARTLEAHIETTFGGCETIARGSGYRVLRSATAARYP